MSVIMGPGSGGVVTVGGGWVWCAAIGGGCGKYEVTIGLKWFLVKVGISWGWVIDVEEFKGGEGWEKLNGEVVIAKCWGCLVTAAGGA